MKPLHRKTGSTSRAEDQASNITSPTVLGSDHMILLPTQEPLYWTSGKALIRQV